MSKKIRITGKVTFFFTQTISVPEDEVEEILADEENLIANVDLNRVVDLECADFEEMEGEVLPG